MRMNSTQRDPDEGYEHYQAKLRVASWFRHNIRECGALSVAVQDEPDILAIPALDTPGFGVFVEFPDPQRPCLWHEDNWQEQFKKETGRDPRCPPERCPTRDQLLAIGRGAHRYADVAVVHGDRVKLVVEIMSHHAVEEEKRAFLESHNLRVLELSASWILRYRSMPLSLIPTHVESRLRSAVRSRSRRRTERNPVYITPV